MKKKLSTLFLIAVFTLLFTSTAFAATKVTNVKQIDASETSVKISFDSILGINRYCIDLSEDGSTWKTVDEYASNTGETVYSLNPGKTYYARVYARDDLSTCSDVIQVVTAPNSVNSVKQTAATTSSITLVWDKSAGATHYAVVTRMNGEENDLAIIASNTCTIKGINNDVDYPASIYIYPIRYSKTFGARSTYGKCIYSYNVKLLPDKITNLRIDDYYSYSNKVSYAFDKEVHADGYEYVLYNYKGKKLKSGKTTYYSYNTLSNVKVGSFYRLKVRAYTNINGRAVYGEWSDTISFAHQTKVNIKRSGRNLKFSWKKIKGVKDYTIYVSTKQKSGYKKVATTKKTSYTLKKFKKKKLSTKKKYYVYVVANTKIGKKKFKSNSELCYYLTRY